ncbi:MAG TPA: hypothetical protein VFU43_19560 [Streptosporangiaceae bacterium]|nr:hypothetical protein [Streptosporangiaceae bacterium]
MLLGPDEMARRIQHRHSPGWLVWHGKYTGHYWALANWAPGPYALLSAATPDALDAAIATFELLHPKPAPRRPHALAH